MVTSGLQREREKERRGEREWEKGVYMYVGTEGKESQNSEDASGKRVGEREWAANVAEGVGELGDEQKSGKLREWNVRISGAGLRNEDKKVKGTYLFPGIP